MVLRLVSSDGGGLLFVATATVLLFYVHTGSRLPTRRWTGPELCAYPRASWRDLSIEVGFGIHTGQRRVK